MDNLDLIVKEDQLLIHNNENPAFDIEVIQLESESCYSQVADEDSIFTVYEFTDSEPHAVYMLFVTNSEEIEYEDEVPTYKLLIEDAWRWLRLNYLYPELPFPIKPRYLKQSAT